MYSCEYNNTSYHTVDVNCWVGVVETGVHGTCRRSTSARSIIRSIQYSYRSNTSSYLKETIRLLLQNVLSLQDLFD